MVEDTMFTNGQAKIISEIFNIKRDKFSIEQFRMCMVVGLEHGRID